MPGINLKHYSAYLDSLNAYIDAHNMKLQFKVHDSEGKYVPSQRLIMIDPDMSDSAEIATILHELGHTMDDSISEGSKIDTAYRMVYKKRATRVQKDLVIATEERAWKYGRAIAKHLRIRLGKWYDREEADALESYRK